MYNMKKRFGLFGFGFAIGIALVFFFLGGKNSSCNWMPNARMLEIIRSKQISYSHQVQARIDDSTIDSTDINNILLDGDIDFSKSQVKNNPCRNYLINGELRNQDVSIRVIICDSLATIEDFKIE